MRKTNSYLGKTHRFLEEQTRDKKVCDNVFWASEIGLSFLVLELPGGRIWVDLPPVFMGVYGSFISQKLLFLVREGKTQESFLLNQLKLRCLQNEIIFMSTLGLQVGFPQDEISSYVKLSLLYE